MRKLFGFILCVAVLSFTVHAGSTESSVTQTKDNIEMASQDVDIDVENSVIIYQVISHSVDMESIPIIVSYAIVLYDNVTVSPDSPIYSDDNISDATDVPVDIGYKSPEVIPFLWYNPDPDELPVNS